jgi:O-antigen ligase
MSGPATVDALGEPGRLPAESSALATMRRGLLPLVGWLGFSLLVVYAVLVGGGYPGIQLVTLRLLSLSMIAIVLAGWAVAAWRLPSWRPGTAIWPALVIPLASMTLSTLLSPFPRLGIEYLAWAVLLVALYLLLVRILSLEFARARIGGLAAILGAMIGLLYLGIVIERWLAWWGLLGHLAIPPLRPGLPGLTFGGPNLVASAVVLLTVIAIAGLGVGSRARAAAIVALTSLSAAVVFVSGSRSAWLALLLASAIVGGLWLLANRQRLTRGVRDRVSRPLLVGLGAVSVLAIVTLGPMVMARITSSGDGGRPAYFATALRMFGDAPVAGLGPGTWAARRTAYLGPSEFDYTVPHAHNVYLQSLAELGFVGALAGAVAVAAVAWLIYRSFRGGDRALRAWAWAAVFGLVYTAIVNMADFYANVPGLLILWVIPVAMLDAASRLGLGVPRALRPAMMGRMATAALGLCCSASIGLLAWAELSAMTNARAAAAADAGDWDTAALAAADAVAADPAQPIHQLTRALAAMHQEDWSTARTAYLQAVAVDDLPQAWVGLAMATQKAGGRADEVAGYLEAAMRVGRQNPSISYAVGEIYDRLGAAVEADDAYVEALARLPLLAADPAWREDAALASRFDALVADAVERAGPGGWQIALLAGDAQHARAAASEAERGAAPSDVIEDTIAAWQGDAQALARMLARAEDDPTEPGLLSMTALLAVRSGDLDAARRLRDLALTSIESPAILGLDVHTASSCEREVRVVASSDLHGQVAYRRPAPRNLLPPGLRCLVLHEPAGEAIRPAGEAIRRSGEVTGADG